MSEYFPVIVDPERIAQLMAHRACIGMEHDPANGKLHGYCVVCGVPWPCDYAGKPPAATQEQPAGSVTTNLQATKDEKRGDVCEGNAPRLLAESPSTFGSPRKVGEDGRKVGSK